MRSSFSTCSRKAITMYKQTCTNLLELSSAKVTEWLSSFDSVITDCDGELVVGGWEVLPTRGRIAPRKLRYIKICIRMPCFSGRHLPKYVSNRKVRCVVAASRISMSKSEVRDMAASRLSDALITHKNLCIQNRKWLYDFFWNPHLCTAMLMRHPYILNICIYIFCWLFLLDIKIQKHDYPKNILNIKPTL